MKRLGLGMASAALLTACVDVTPAAERDRLVVLAPPAARAAIDTMLASFSPLGTTLPPAAIYLEAGELLRQLDEDPRVGVVATFDDFVVESLLARQRIVDRTLVADAGLVAVGSVVVGDMAALVDSGASVAVQERNSGAIGAQAYDGLLRYGALSRLGGRLRATRGVEESVRLLQSGAVDAAVVLAPEALEADLPLLFVFDPGLDQPLSLQLLLLHERHADARAVFDHLRSSAALATFIARGWSEPR